MLQGNLMIAPKGRLEIILSFVLQKLAMEDSSLSVISSRSSGDEEARQQLVATSSTLESWTLNCRSTGHTSPHLVLNLFRPSPPPPPPHQTRLPNQSHRSESSGSRRMTSHLEANRQDIPDCCCHAPRGESNNDRTPSKPLSIRKHLQFTGILHSGITRTYRTIQIHRISLGRERDI